MNAEELKKEILEFKKIKTKQTAFIDDWEYIFNEAIIFLGINNYPNGSNPLYSCFKNNPYVAFFSVNKELSFFLILSILLSSKDEATQIMEDLYGQNQLYSPSDLAEYLAFQRHIFFFNVEDNYFTNVVSIIKNKHLKIKILKLFKKNSSSSKNLNALKTLLTDKKVRCAKIIHPSIKNLNKRTKNEWINTYIINNYKGSINGKLKYSDFTI